MTIKEIYNKAKEAGYAGRLYSKGNIEYLDPQFWQSLGKAMGWERITRRRASSENPEFLGKRLTYFQDEIDGWLYHWHKFIDHLAEGKAIEDYFSKL